MLNILSGFVAVGLSAAGVWYFAPRNGTVHPLILKPFLDSTVTIVIMTVFIVGLALIVDGFI